MPQTSPNLWAGPVIYAVGFSLIVHATRVGIALTRCFAIVVLAYWSSDLVVKWIALIEYANP